MEHYRLHFSPLLSPYHPLGSETSGEAEPERERMIFSEMQFPSLFSSFAKQLKLWDFENLARRFPKLVS